LRAEQLRDLEGWLGKERVSEDLLSPAAARALAATLDRDPGPLHAGVALPPGWHWIYFTPAARRSELGPDGHEKRGGFLPPIPLPRRMWAGGRLRFHGPLSLGEPATRVSTIDAISAKEGRSGPLVFLTVRHRVLDARGDMAIDEEQDLVYRAAATGGGAGGAGVGLPAAGAGAAGGDATASTPASSSPLPTPAESDWTETFTADVVTLFRFSALTFNGHRIHYDREYATATERYPGLVVHGPLLALLLLDAGVRHGSHAASAFRYRALSPLFCDEEFLLAGRREEGPGATAGASKLWAAHPRRGVAMEATLQI
jgi:3-methylfumaryl-CoA hydratase